MPHRFIGKGSEHHLVGGAGQRLRIHNLGKNRAVAYTLVRNSGHRVTVTGRITNTRNRQLGNHGDHLTGRFKAVRPGSSRWVGIVTVCSDGEVVLRCVDEILVGDLAGGDVQGADDAVVATHSAEPPACSILSSASNTVSAMTLTPSFRSYCARRMGLVNEGPASSYTLYPWKAYP